MTGQQQAAVTPSWNNSTTIVRVIRDRLHEQSWGACPTMQLPVIGPALELDERPLDFGEGHWR